MNIEGIKEYYESEYRTAKLFIDDVPSWITKGKIIHNAIQRLIGVAQCAQYCGITYEEMDKLYSEYRQKFEALENEENV